MNKTPVTPPEFGIYTISKNYINYLRKVDANVTDPEITNIYCGPVCRMDTKKGPTDYFVPVDVNTFNTRSGFVMAFCDGVLADLMDFKRMIPCLPTEYKLNASNSKLTEFCISEKELIEECAKIVMDAYANR